MDVRFVRVEEETPARVAEEVSDLRAQLGTAHAKTAHLHEELLSAEDQEKIKKRAELNHKLRRAVGELLKTAATTPVHAVSARCKAEQLVREDYLNEAYERQDGSPVIIITYEHNFFCACCPPQPWQPDGMRRSGMAFSNVYAHMGSKLHFKNFYEAVHGRSSTEEEWLQYTAGNAYGPMRALRTKHLAQAAKRQRHKQLMRRWRGIVHGLAGMKAAQQRAAKRAYAPGACGFEESRVHFEHLAGAP